MTTIKHRTPFFLVLMLFIFALATGAMAHGTGSDHTHPENEQGIETARLWLDLVDQEKYTASWQTAASIFKESITSKPITFEQWEKTIKTIRIPLGKLVQRNLFHDRFTTTLPGMPDGRYLILRFVTTYQHKQSAVETITLVKDDKDTWKVAGYFIK